jgi:hypothetical protein
MREKAMDGKRQIGMRVCLSAIASAGLLALATASSAAAAVTIGQTATPTNPCANNADRLQPTVTSGRSYVVPSTIAAGTITSWSTEALPGAGQRLAMKVYRPIGGATYQVVGQAGPHDLTGGVLNTFPASVPVKAGDILGNSVEPAGGSPGCNFVVPGENYLTRTGNLAVGASGDFATGTADRRQNISAVVNPLNSFTLGKAKLNKNTGIATVTANVPNPGELTASGKGVKATGAAAISKTVAAPGKVKLKIRAKGKKKAKLNDTGKVKVKPKITYTPTGGAARTVKRKVKLKKNI